MDINERLEKLHLFLTGRESSLRVWWGMRMNIVWRNQKRQKERKESERKKRVRKKEKSQKERKESERKKRVRKKEKSQKERKESERKKRVRKKEKSQKERKESERSPSFEALVCFWLEEKAVWGCDEEWEWMLFEREDEWKKRVRKMSFFWGFSLFLLWIQ